MDVENQNRRRFTDWGCLSRVSKKLDRSCRNCSECMLDLLNVKVESIYSMLTSCIQCDAAFKGVAATNCEVLSTYIQFSFMLACVVLLK